MEFYSEAHKNNHTAAIGDGGNDVSMLQVRSKSYTVDKVHIDR